MSRTQGIRDMQGAAVRGITDSLGRVEEAGGGGVSTVVDGFPMTARKLSNTLHRRRLLVVRARSF